MSGKPCEPNCQCGKHRRTSQHNVLIGLGVARHYREKKMK